jgi:hypothetical protein
MKDGKNTISHGREEKIRIQFDFKQKIFNARINKGERGTVWIIILKLFIKKKRVRGWTEIKRLRTESSGMHF